MATTPLSHGSPPETLATTGIEGLDDVLRGGLTPNRLLYLLEGVPGSGKTTLAVQFSMAGVRRSEPVLCELVPSTSVRPCATSAGR